MNNFTTQMQVRPQAQHARCFSGLCYLLIALLLGGCEAQLKLEGVVQEKTKPIVRFDGFQSSAYSAARGIDIVVGDAGVVLKSSDRGKTWQRSDLKNASLPVSLIDVVNCPAGHFVALDFNKNVWLSNAYGEDWSSMPIATDEDVMAIACDTNSRLWVVGAFASILVSSDGGKNWSAQHSLDDDFILTSIQFIDAQSGFIIGEFGKLLKSEDGGESWVQINTLPEEFYPLTAYFMDEQRGWVGGLKGTILSTNDGGQSWSRDATDTDAPLYSISGAGNAVFVVGNNGVTLVENGNHWKQIDLPEETLSYLRAITVHDRGARLLVAGGRGALQMFNVNKNTPL